MVLINELPDRILQIGAEDLEAGLPLRAYKPRPSPWSARSRHQNQEERSKKGLKV